MTRRSNFEPNVEQAPWSKREIVLTVVFCSCLIGWYVVHEINMGKFREKTRLVKVGMSLNDAVAILGTPTKRQEAREDFLRHDERPRCAELGKENPLIEITWNGTGYIFRAFVVKEEIIATRIKRKNRK